jgi:Ser/Thr protein kinase RdoA (MazF antagonist)
VAAPLAKEKLQAIAKKSLRHWQLDVASLTLISQSENTVFRVETDQHETYALRLHRPGYHSLVELESEQLWTRALADGGIAIPKVEPTEHGKYYVEESSDTEDTSRVVGLIQWLPGTPLSAVLADHPSAAELQRTYFALGALIARCHLASMVWTPPAGFVRHAWDHAGFVGDAPFWGRFWELTSTTQKNRSHLRDIRNAVSLHLGALPKTSENFGMIHADLHADNVLRYNDVLYVIDFDDAGYGWHAFDLAVAVHHQLDFFHPQARFDTACSALIAGYDSVRPGCEDIFAQLPIFLLVRSLMILKWIEDRPEVGRNDSIPILIELALEQSKAL